MFYFRLFQRKNITDDEQQDNDDVSIDGLEFINAFDILEGPTEGNEEEILLPPHHRCASHTLNLIAVKDSELALEDANFKKVSRSSMAKCSKLWNKQNQSTQIADHIKDTCAVYLSTPVVTS